MSTNRDLLVMFKENFMSPQDLDRQLLLLNELLFTTERLDNFVNAHEVLDLNRYKVISNPVAIKKLIRQKKLLTPFLFFSNKN